MYSTFEAEGSKLCTLNLNELKLYNRLKAERLFYSFDDCISCINACLYKNIESIILSNGDVIDTRVNHISENFIVNTIEDGMVYLIGLLMSDNDNDYVIAKLRDMYEYLEFNFSNIRPNMMQTVIDLRKLLEILMDYHTYKEDRIGSNVMTKFFYELMLNLVSSMKENCYKIVLKYKYKKLLDQTSEFTGDDSKYFA